MLAFFKRSPTFAAGELASSIVTTVVMLTTTFITYIAVAGVAVAA